VQNNTVHLIIVIIYINNKNNKLIIITGQMARDLDDLSLIPYQEGRPLCGDVMVICPLASSYLQSATASASTVAELAATRKVAT